MSPNDDRTTGRRVDAYFTASFEVARRLADNHGDQAVAILRKELDRLPRDEEAAGRRFLMSQIAVCHARMADVEALRDALEEMEDTLPHEFETALMLSEGYLLLAKDAERASAHASSALEWAVEHGEDSEEPLARAQGLLARALLASRDVTGAFGAWSSSPLPDWRLAVELIEAGASRDDVRAALLEAIPRHEESERRLGAEATASSDQMRRMVKWIDAGCPRTAVRSKTR